MKDICAQNMPLLTIFTPAYNRADTIGRTYESLCRQTCKDFEWLIIDDGSKDGTRKLVQSWLIDESLELIGESGFAGFSKDAPWLRIRYEWKENGGLHTGYNKAIELMDTELCICIDSDDYMADNTVERIYARWEECKDNPEVAGIIGLDYYDGKMTPIGGKFSREEVNVHVMDLGRVLHHYGDMKIVCRVELMKKYWPMQVFEGEKNFNPFYYYLQIDNDHTYYVVNENFCIVDYQEGGMTANILNQFYNSPRSFACYREAILRQKRLPLAYRLRNAMHFGSSILFTGEYGRLFQAPAAWMKVVMFPLAILLNLYIRIKRKK